MSIRRRAQTLHDFPLYTHTIGRMLDSGGLAVFASCFGGCWAHDRIDLAALIARVGRDYSLVNRRCRCRCGRGWIKFMFRDHGGLVTLETEPVRLARKAAALEN